MSVSIQVNETTGSIDVVGPDSITQFISSGTHSGDNVSISANGLSVNIDVGVTESTDNVSITGVNSGDSIEVSVLEGGRGDLLSDGSVPMAADFNFNNYNLLNGGFVELYDQGIYGPPAPTGEYQIRLYTKSQYQDAPLLIYTKDYNGFEREVGGTYILPSSPEPLDTEFFYNSDDQLTGKIDASGTVRYTYNINGTLNQVIDPDYTKTMYYDEGGLLTGIDVS